MTEWGFAPSASAWRVETVLRDFEPKRPLDVVFDYPLHHVDTTGYLSEFSILSPQSVGGGKRGEQRKAERDDNIKAMEDYVVKLCAGGQYAVSIGEIAQHFGKTKKTVVAWSERSEALVSETFGQTKYLRPAAMETS